MQLSLGFTAAIQSYLLASEGGYVDNPKDPGGATNWGITFNVLQAWRKTKITKADVKSMTKDEAIRIYTAQYWNTMQCQNLPLGLDYMMMDYGVNSGPARAIKDLQRTVGSPDDGVLGQKTIAAILAFVSKSGIAKLLYDFAEKRWEFMQGLSTFKTFGNGWKRRVWGSIMGAQASDTGVVDRATKLAAGQHDQIAMPLVSEGKAIPEKTSALDMIKDPTTLTGVAGAFATVVGAIQNQPVIQIAAVVAIVAVVAVYLYHQRKADPT